MLHPVYFKFGEIHIKHKKGAHVLQNSGICDRCLTLEGPLMLKTAGERAAVKISSKVLTERTVSTQAQRNRAKMIITSEAQLLSTKKIP